MHVREGRQEEKLTQDIKKTNLQSKTGNDRKRQTKRISRKHKWIKA